MLVCMQGTCLNDLNYTKNFKYNRHYHYCYKKIEVTHLKGTYMSEKRNTERWTKAMREIPSLTENHDKYREVFLRVSPSFLQKGNVYGTITEYFDSHVMGTFQNATDHDSHRKRMFNVLAVGLGEGKNEFHMLQKLSSHFDSIRVTAVEPNKGMLLTFVEKLKDCDVTKAIECRPFQGTYDEFLQSTLADCKFDFITAIHSLYYTGDIKCVIESMLLCLHNTGIIYADVMSDENVLAEECMTKPWLFERSVWTPCNDIG
ncbi:histamine N-methyltransferase A-like [Lytechinus pictus]|uniref:histamine N-methyltransferase A-like n=1 Tax=Lytechinus pictus TaxID=7653 RepID=UPI0030B9F293